MEDKLYFPSNGTEGDYFTDKWCANCRKDTGLRGGTTYCPILNKSLVEGRPIKQWVYKDDKPTCTSFVSYKTYERKTKRPLKNQLTVIFD